MIAVVSAMLTGCAFKTADQVVERDRIPAAIPGVPASQSEIREIKFNKVTGESAHKDLHVRGMLFSKSSAGEIRPCPGCEVMLKGVKDTSLMVKLLTEPDGYFTFHGEQNTYRLTMNNKGHNSFLIDEIEFNVGGVTSLILINAAGSGSDHFVVSQHDKRYTWTRR